ncbi:MAG: hypothetical protein K8R79_12265, partial [Calditrichales bacterium]|nr:hypothetical protein [Calditrichales bacterium]
MITENDTGWSGVEIPPLRGYLMLDAGWKSRFCGDDQVSLSSIYFNTTFPENQPVAEHPKCHF